MSNIDITGNESFDELESKLSQIEALPDEDISDDDSDAVAPPQSTDIPTGETRQPATDTVAENPPPGEQAAALTPTPGRETGAVVRAKDGIHAIPYAVLEATRERARLAEERAFQLEAEAAKVMQLEQQLQGLKQRAAEAGISEDLLAGDGLSDEQLTELSEEYPALGRHLRALTQKINAITVQEPAPVAAQPGANPVEVALMHAPDLDGWRVDDPDRWAMATVIDTQLQKDSAFTGKPLVQRFQEVERRVKAAFGDTTPPPGPAEIAAQAESKVAAAAAQLPGSPSDIGSTVTYVPDKAAQIAAMDGNALLHSMNTMSDAEIDALLSGLEL